MSLPHDYEERLYAGVLGKIIGVYLGRPFEGWWYDRITQQLGEIWYYVHERLNAPLIVTDDDLTGTFTFVRALEDYGVPAEELTAEQVGKTWLNYVIEGRTVFWWGGLGNSTEHTAFLRLRSGIPAPQSGSIELNGKTVAEQIGAQIFIDAWGMVCPGEPELAARLAREAASVSHDGEAVYAAQVVAAMEALAFVEQDTNALLDTALKLIPEDSVIARLIRDVRSWHAVDGDWRRTRERIAAQYGYDQYGGNCHVVPNHALIHLGLLYSNDDFQRALMITNTCGWDTDCNSGNLGCLMGIKLGLEGIERGPDWRGPIADRVYLPTADGGSAITDAVQITDRLLRIARRLRGEPTWSPKGGYRYHFSYPGSVQGFRLEDSPECRGTAVLENVLHPRHPEERCLGVRFDHVAPGRAVRVGTATFIPPEAQTMGGYGLRACPTLYNGQTIHARVYADAENRGPVPVNLYVRVYEGEGDGPSLYRSEPALLSPAADYEFAWTLSLPTTGPIAEVGIEVRSREPLAGTLYLDALTWTGTPRCRFARPTAGGTMWQRAWLDAADAVQYYGAEDRLLRMIQNRETGLLLQGTREWSDYRVRATMVPRLAERCGVIAYAQGLTRYYALLLLRPNRVALIRSWDQEEILAEADLSWEFDREYRLELTVEEGVLRARIGEEDPFGAISDPEPLSGGAIGLLVTEGTVEFGRVSVEPV